MKYAVQHLQTATHVIADYYGSIPLHHHLKSYFAKHKKYGSKDRKNISHLCYSFFRLGHAGKDLAAADRIKIVLFLTNADEWEELLPMEWQQKLNDPLDEKINFINNQFQGLHCEDIFPFRELSAGINVKEFSLSHLFQPKLFIRIRKGMEASVKQKLAGAKRTFHEVYNDCLAFANNTRVEDVLNLNKEYVVQDYNSQQVGNLMRDAGGKNMKVWDCCAASGGKSIMAVDLLDVHDLLVTDIRASIIQNLQNRFKEAGINNYKSIVADATNAKQLVQVLGKKEFDLVICDAPCSGSGTWGRTPEQLHFFQENNIGYYANLQKQIATNAMKYVSKEGYLLYITCSVFREENEAIVKILQQTNELELIKTEVLKGYSMQADTMFAALFKKL